MEFQKSYWTKFCKNVAFCNSAVEIFRVLFIPTLRQSCRNFGAEGAQAPPFFVRSINPISTMGAHSPHSELRAPFGFLDFATAL